MDAVSNYRRQAEASVGLLGLRFRTFNLAEIQKVLAETPVECALDVVTATPETTYDAAA